MANSVPPITPGSIVAMAGLTRRPVYFVTLAGHATPNLVVKGEAGTNNHPGITDANAAISVKWGSKMMKNVNCAQVNTKLMTPAEVAVFQAAAAATFGLGTPQHTNSTNPNNMYMWVKMPYVAGLSDADYYDANNDVEVDKIKANVVRFADHQLWSDLGKVVAVDLFTGNNDRFTSAGHWQNKGNVMFMPAGAPTTVIGLDTFDPNGGVQADLVGGGRFNELRILTDPAQRSQFADQCTRSVGREMQRAFKASPAGKHVASFALRTVGPGGVPGMLRVDVDQMHTLFTAYAPDFDRGIADGARDLRTYLQGKVRQYAPPPAPTPWARAVPNGAGPGIVFGAARGRTAALQNIAAAAAAAPAPVGPPKVVPQGVLDRMAFLGW